MDIDFINRSNSSSSSVQDDDDQIIMADDEMMMFMEMEKLQDFSDITDYFPMQELTNNNHHFQPNNNINILDNHSNNQIPFSSSVSTTPPPPPPIKKPPSTAAMREMIYRIAAMQPIHIDPESVKPPKRRNVRISKDPQSVAARRRRERISERIRILQRLVPGGTKMDTASMLDEAVRYVKFLKDQVRSLGAASGGGGDNGRVVGGGLGFPVPMSSGRSSYFPVVDDEGYVDNLQTMFSPNVN